MKNQYNKTLNEDRKEAVIESYFNSMRELVSKDPFVSQREIAEHAVKSIAPRFFTTYENARRIISLMIRRKKIPIINKNRIEMYKEIYKRFIKRSKENLYSYGSYKLLEDIINSPAPSFYMNINTFQGILYKTLRERSNKKFVSSINTDII